MKICHSQPHLVPPMRLVLYDELPSPASVSRISSFPSWMAEGRNRYSKLSSRASLSYRRKSTTTSRLRISAPSDFRRVNPPSARVGQFNPLELSIYKAENRLSDLPTFDDFYVGDCLLVSPPSQVLSPVFDRSRRYTASEHRLRRKPVGSGSSRSSFAALEPFLDARPEEALLSPLIPHFATRSSIVRPLSKEPSPQIPPSLDIFSPPFSPKTKRTTIPPKPLSTLALQERPLPPIPSEASSRQASQAEPMFTHRPRTASSGSQRSGRVAKWLLSSSSSSPHDNVTPPSPISSKYSYSSKMFSSRGRSRTLSGSTISSLTATPTTGVKRPTPSLSSILTAATTARVSTTTDNHPFTEKDVEAGRMGGAPRTQPSTCELARLPPSPAFPAQREFPKCLPGTIVEGCPQELPPGTSLSYDFFHSKYHGGAVGVAF